MISRLIPRQSRSPVETRRDVLIDKIATVLDVSDMVCEETAERIIKHLKQAPLEEVEDLSNELEDLLLQFAQQAAETAIFCAEFASDSGRLSSVL